MEAALNLLNTQRAGDRLAPLGTVLTLNTPPPAGPYPRGRGDQALGERPRDGDTVEDSRFLEKGGR